MANVLPPHTSIPAQDVLLHPHQHYVFTIENCQVIAQVRSLPRIVADALFSSNIWYISPLLFAFFFFYAYQQQMVLHAEGFDS